MGQIIPLEITTKSNSKAKSLSVFMKKFTVPQAYRITENNFRQFFYDVSACVEKDEEFNQILKALGYK